MKERTDLELYREERLRAALRHSKWARAYRKQAAADMRRGDEAAARASSEMAERADAAKLVELDEAQRAHDEIRGRAAA